MKIVMETILGKEGYDEWVKRIEEKKPLYDRLRDPDAQETVLCEPSKKKRKTTRQKGLKTNTETKTTIKTKTKTKTKCN